MGSQYSRSVRKIDGETYLDTLKDVATSQYYDWFFPFDEKPELRGHKIWHSEHEIEGWEMLILAIVSHSAQEYVKAILYEKEWKRESPSKERETTFLNYWMPEIKESLDYEIRQAKWKYGTYGIKRLLARMKVYW